MLFSFSLLKSQSKFTVAPDIVQQVNDTVWMRFEIRQPYTSVAFDFKHGFIKTAAIKLAPSNADFLTLNELNYSHFVTHDEHFESTIIDRSNLIFLNNSPRWIVLKIASKQREYFSAILAHCVYVVPLNSSLNFEISKRAQCDSPSWIPQSVWRSGLPPPVKGRNMTKTSHCIVHHSGGGNGDTNYTELVRNYYTFHTQVNGWDDIGYNFLIAGNGVIYAGRDPEKPGIRQDNVQGAHFCSKNSKTMGTCLIGDFSTHKPSLKAINALYHLLGWKIKMDSLNPFGFDPHPSVTDPLLGVISGHRDGCATICPGDSLFGMLSEIKHAIQDCSVVSGVSDSRLAGIIVYEIPEGWVVKNISKESSVYLFNINGQLLFSKSGAGQSEIKIPASVPGVYFLQLTEPSNRATRAKLFKTQW